MSHKQLSCRLGLARMSSFCLLLSDVLRRGAWSAYAWPTCTLARSFQGMFAGCTHASCGLVAAAGAAVEVARSPVKLGATARLRLLHCLPHALPAVGTVCMLTCQDRLASRDCLVAIQGILPGAWTLLPWTRPLLQAVLRMPCWPPSLCCPCQMAARS